MFSTAAPQVQGVQHAVVMAPRIDTSLEVGTFPRLTTRSIKISDEYDLLNKFLKLKPAIFKGAESEDTYDFPIYCHEMLHNMYIQK